MVPIKSHVLARPTIRVVEGPGGGNSGPSDASRAEIAGGSARLWLKEDQPQPRLLEKVVDAGDACTPYRSNSWGP